MTSKFQESLSDNIAEADQVERAMRAQSDRTIAIGRLRTQISLLRQKLDSVKFQQLTERRQKIRLSINDLNAVLRGIDPRLVVSAPLDANMAGDEEHPGSQQRDDVDHVTAIGILAKDQISLENATRTRLSQLPREVSDALGIDTITNEMGHLADAVIAASMKLDEVHSDHRGRRLRDLAADIRSALTSLSTTEPELDMRRSTARPLPELIILARVMLERWCSALTEFPAALTSAVLEVQSLAEQARGNTDAKRKSIGPLTLPDDPMIEASLRGTTISFDMLVDILTSVHDNRRQEPTSITTAE